MLYDVSMGVILLYEHGLLWVHKKAFGEPMGPKMLDFIKQLHWSVVGGGIASVLLFMASVVAGRTLGAIEFGHYYFAVSGAQIIALFITLSFDTAIVRALAFTKGDLQSQKYIISSALGFLLVSLVCVNALLLVVPQALMSGIVILFAGVLSVKLISDGIIRGLGIFEYQAIGKIIEAVLICLIFGILVTSGMAHTYGAFMVAGIVGGMGLIAWHARIIIKHVSLRTISSSAFQVLWSYSSHAVMWIALSLCIGFAGRFIIKEIVGYQFLGQFSVYQLVTVSAFAFLGALVANVFFPVSAQEGDSNDLWQKMHRTASISWLPLWLVAGMVAYIAVFLYGPAYYLAWWFGVGMAGIAVTQFLCGMYWWIIASDGPRGMRYMAIHTAMSGFVFVILLASFLRMHALYAILLSYMCASVYVVWAIYRWRVLLKR